MRIACLPAALAAISFVVGCREPTGEAARVGASFAVSGPAACPAPPSPSDTLASYVTVTDEASLVAAVGSAKPFEVIALNGFFPVSADVVITTPLVTLTCATPGSGIFAPQGSTVVFLLVVHAFGVTVDRLVLDGGNLGEGPYLAETDPTLNVVADGARLTNNTVSCGVGECPFFVGTRDAFVADNAFKSAGSGTGLHMQSGIDGSQVLRNTIVATAPSTVFGFGGLRIRDGSNVVVADNIVKGPWSNSIAAANLFGSSVENNRFEGAVVDGIRFSVGPPLMISNSFRNNQITGAGDAGVFVQWACSNTFLGNSIEGSGRSPSAIFAATTGANVLVLIGAKNSVIDNGGGFDCNGDGVGDPNIIAGPGRVVRRVSVASPADAAVGSSGRLR